MKEKHLWSELIFYAIILGVSKILWKLDMMHQAIANCYIEGDSGRDYQKSILAKRESYGL